MYPAVPHQARFGPYLILRKIGEGAMSKVYLARHTGALAARGEVALKVLRHEYSAQTETLQLLRREALIGQRMHHPNVISTLEFGEIDGLPYLAMEYVKGVTVADLLEMVEERDRGLPPELAAVILVQVCAGLSYAHNLTDHTGKPYGVVHRDLKPGNVMVSLSGVAKVMDFGVAKIKLFSDGLTTVRKTRGTPAYMSPEQANGQKLTHHSDIFAAGLMLYEMLTGERPFQADNLNELIHLVREGSLQGRDGTLERFGRGLARIFRRATHVDPAQRYPDASWLREDLELIFPADTPIPLPALGGDATAYYTIDDAEPPTERMASPGRRSPPLDDDRGGAPRPAQPRRQAHASPTTQRSQPVARPPRGGPGPTAPAVKALRPREAGPTPARGPSALPLPAGGSAGAPRPTAPPRPLPPGGPTTATHGPLALPPKLPKPEPPPAPRQIGPDTDASMSMEIEELELDPETMAELDLEELPELDLDDETIPEVDLGPPVFLELRPKPDPKVPASSDTLTHLTQFLIEVDS